MPIMSISDKFQADLEAFLVISGMHPTDFGKSAFNDPNFVFDLRRGRSPSARLIDRGYDYINTEREKIEKKTKQLEVAA